MNFSTSQTWILQEISIKKLNGEVQDIMFGHILSDKKTIGWKRNRTIVMSLSEHVVIELTVDHLTIISDRQTKKVTYIWMENTWGVQIKEMVFNNI